MLFPEHWERTSGQDRWRWLVTSVVLRFRRFEADTQLVGASLRRIFDEARGFASTPASRPVYPPSSVGPVVTPAARRNNSRAARMSLESAGAGSLRKPG